jgi:hypothetical protein
MISNDYFSGFDVLALSKILLPFPRVFHTPLQEPIMPFMSF